MLDYVNGRTSDHMATLSFVAINALLLAFIRSPEHDFVGTFLFSTWLTFSFVGFLGGIWAYFSKNKLDIVGVANWLVLFFIALNVVFLFLER